MEIPIISVIVPVYNVEKYLRRCIDSIINQTYKIIEIILVDDGSTDNSGIICDEYATKDNRIHTIHKKNGGLSDARNVAIDIAVGKYLAFIDSDDYVTEDYIEFLYDLLCEHDADISICSKIDFYENVCPNTPLNSGKIKCFTGRSAMENMFYQKDITTSAWAKLYRKDLFEKIRYPKGKLYEDLGTTYKVFFESDKIVWSPVQKYYYLQRENSIMNKKFTDKKFDRIEISEEILDFVKKRVPEVLPAAEVRFFISNVQVLREMPYKENQYSEEIKNIRSNIKMLRKKIIRNSSAKGITRLIAVSTYLNFGTLQLLGKLYKRLYER